MTGRKGEGMKAERLDGKEVALKMTEEVTCKVKELKEKGIDPTLAIVRIGENPGDIAYEKGALKRAEKMGIEVKQFILPSDADEDEVVECIKQINDDDSIHGVLMFRPLPKHMNEAKICETLDPRKDVDGITSGSMAGVFMGTDRGYPPCTAEACIAILDHYGIDLEGKKVTVMGRSPVIGKPVAMLAMKRNATITVLHSRTGKENFAEAGRGADVVIAAIGKPKWIGKDQIGDDQIILDVGINVDENGKLCGDVDPAPAEEKAKMLTPVPGGVGSVTTAILMKHVVQAADKILKCND